MEFMYLHMYEYVYVCVYNRIIPAPLYYMSAHTLLDKRNLIGITLLAPAYNALSWLFMKPNEQKKKKETATQKGKTN